MSYGQSKDQMRYMRTHPKASSISWQTVGIQSPIKINILKVTPGETNAYVIKLLSVLEAKRKGREERRVIPLWRFRLFPLSTTAAAGFRSPYSGFAIRSSPIPHVLNPIKRPNQGSSSSALDIWLTNLFLKHMSRNYPYCLIPLCFCPSRRLPPHPQRDRDSTSVLTQRDASAWFIYTQP